ncbi:hypothetical protein CDAR_27641 [Caerostris darwini]|uniref:Uncharacterized protein n=1 Tax=Caerostris darwini TaxID=1538125 RepID=A0AAV4ST48_9ARAC|nr:hypothetical protein CDAR_27641 [Caerostris darwini]
MISDHSRNPPPDQTHPSSHRESEETHIHSWEHGETVGGHLLSGGWTKIKVLPLRTLPITGGSNAHTLAKRDGVEGDSF